MGDVNAGRPDKVCCDTCVFWDRNGPSGYGAAANQRICKRHAPGSNAVQAWTDPDDWCGEWRDKWPSE